jgi:hypothetical protein
MELERNFQIIGTPTNTGDPVEVFFPGKDKIIAVYRKGYIPIFPADGRAGDWLATDLFGAALRGMMRVRFWDSGFCKEKLLVEAYGSVGDVQEDGIESLSDFLLGPVRVVAVCGRQGSDRELVLLSGYGEEDVRTNGRMVAFCKHGDGDVVVDATVVHDEYYVRKGVWVRFIGQPDSGLLVKRYRLPEEGEVEMGLDIATILKPSGEVFLAKPSKNVGNFLADGVWGVGLSPDGSRLVMLLQKPGEKLGDWFWDFRWTSKPQETIRQLRAPSLGDLSIPIEKIVLRISPDFRWAALATPGYVAVLPVPEVEV